MSWVVLVLPIKYLRDVSMIFMEYFRKFIKTSPNKLI